MNETHCEYTGMKLWAVPCMISKKMQFFREDGWIRRCRFLTEEEIMHIRKHPHEFRQQRATLTAWLATTKH